MYKNFICIIFKLNSIIRKQVGSKQILNSAKPVADPLEYFDNLYLY